MKNVSPLVFRKPPVSDAEFIHCSECKVKDCSVLRNCDSECLELISSSKKMCRFVSGQRILMEGNFAKGIYFIEEGKVKIYIIGYNSTDDASEYHVSAIAITDVLTCFIDAETFLSLTKKFPDFAFALLQYYKKQLQLTERKTLKMATMTVPEKVADALVTMYEAYGAFGERNTLNLTLSRQDIANLASTTKEQVSKAISELKSKGIIDAKGKQIDLLDIDKLSAIGQL